MTPKQMTNQLKLLKIIKILKKMLTIKTKLHKRLKQLLKRKRLLSSTVLHIPVTKRQCTVKDMLKNISIMKDVLVICSCQG